MLGKSGTVLADEWYYILLMTRPGREVGAISGSLALTRDGDVDWSPNVMGGSPTLRPAPLYADGDHPQAALTLGGCVGAAPDRGGWKIRIADAMLLQTVPGRGQLDSFPRAVYMYDPIEHHREMYNLKQSDPEVKDVVSAAVAVLKATEPEAETPERTTEAVLARLQATDAHGIKVGLKSPFLPLLQALLQRAMPAQQLAISLEAYRLWVELEPGNAVVLEGAADLSIGLGRWEEGIGWMLAAREGTTRQVDAALLLGRQLLPGLLTMMRRAHATDPAGPGWQPLLASIQASCPSLSATIANLSTALVNPAAADITTLRRGDFVALCEACVADQQALRAMTLAGGRWEAGNSHGWRPLHYSALLGSASLAAAMIAEGAAPLVRTAEGSTPLHVAAARGFGSVVAALRSAMDSQSFSELAAATDGNGRTALEVYCASGLDPVLRAQAATQVGSHPPLLTVAEALQTECAADAEAARLAASAAKEPYRAGQHNPIHEATELRAELAGLKLGALKQRARGMLDPTDYLEFLDEIDNSDDPITTARELIVEGHAWQQPPPPPPPPPAAQGEEEEEEDDAGGWEGGAEEEAALLSRALGAGQALAPDHCELTVRQSAELSAEELRSAFLDVDRPLLLRGRQNPKDQRRWDRLRTVWRREYLLEKYGDVQLSTGAVPHAATFRLPTNTTTLGRFIADQQAAHVEPGIEGALPYVFESLEKEHVLWGISSETPTLLAEAGEQALQATLGRPQAFLGVAGTGDHQPTPTHPVLMPWCGVLILDVAAWLQVRRCTFTGMRTTSWSMAPSSGPSSRRRSP